DQPEAAAPATPSSREAMPVEAASPTVKTAPSAFGGTSDISKEFELMRQREEGRKEVIRNLRKEAQEHPNAENTLSKERIDQLEKSGVSLD
ncbi:MAG: hypothetical protein ABIJ53_07055, partial [Verrucomicrobiota bacterium]